MAIGKQRRSTLDVGLDEVLDRRGGIVSDHRETNAAGAGIEVFCMFGSRVGPVRVAINHFDRACDKDFPSVAGFKKTIAGPEWNFRLIDFDDSFERFAVRIDHRAPELLRQQPGRFIGEAKLIFELPRRHAIGMRRHEMCGPEPCRQRQLGAVHRRARRYRSLATAIEAFECMGSALQRHGAASAAARTDKTVRPSPLEQERRAGRVIGEGQLKLVERPRLCHGMIRRRTSRRLNRSPIPHLDEPGTTG